MARYGKGRWGFSYKPPVEVTPTPPPEPPPSGSLIVNEVANESLVSPAGHADVIWRGNYQNKSEAVLDWAANPATLDREIVNGNPINGDPNGEKFEFIDVSEYGVRGMRWKSRSSITNWPGNTDGATICNWRKRFRNGSAPSHANYSGSPMGSTPVTDFYYRFCILFEPSVWLGFTEPNGFKLPGPDADEAVTPKIGGTAWHSRVGSGPIHFYFNTYWYGNQPGGGTYHDQFGGGHVLPTINAFEIVENTWYSVEVHFKVNSFTGSTPNADAMMEYWINDQLAYSASNFVLRPNLPSSGVNEFSHIHMQLFHGGNSFPSQPMFYKMFGHVVANRRIGKPKLV